MTPKEHAEWLIQYFERLTKETDWEVWSYGLKTAQKWLSLINNPSVSQAQVSALLGVVHANGKRSSGWFDLALGVYHWASTSGFPVPPLPTFFSSGELPKVTPGIWDNQVLAENYAETLIKHFDQYANEDPEQPLWYQGKDTAQRWLMLIGASSISQEEVAELIEAAYLQRGSSHGWFSLSIGLYYWSKQKGFSDQWPEEFRSWLDTFDWTK